jgi:hypothetical protein
MKTLTYKILLKKYLFFAFFIMILRVFNVLPRIIFGKMLFKKIKFGGTLIDFLCRENFLFAFSLFSLYNLNVISTGRFKFQSE